MTNKQTTFLGTGGIFHDKFVSKEVQLCVKKKKWPRNWSSSWPVHPTLELKIMSRKLPSRDCLLMCSKFYGVPTVTIQAATQARKPSHKHGAIMDLWVVMPLLKLEVQLCNDQDSIALYCYKSFTFASVLTDAFLIDFRNSLQFSCPQLLANIASLAPTLLDAFFCINTGYRWSHHVMLDNLYWFSLTPGRNPRSTVSGIYFTHSYANVIRQQAISYQRYIAIDFW